ncbi:hypothetical protein KK137_10410 [Croceibacterium sp. LX-88]|uniref:Uncharacterized protein n=1 Tax=Croceibacterium selenioxidans TaxID=2838833 RepID=A0ABS5W4S0_9SPHN|nr:hypothetical protein [Croceibacterium selenioxidans]MBT2134747.1 hypothetical protein [Croceibacterium selenioxidans]
MSEGIVRAVLEDAGYRVTDFGIEKLIPGLNRHPLEHYRALAYPAAIRKLPDFVVTAGDEQSKQLVEVKYRTDWQLEVLTELREQVAAMQEIVLVSFNASAPNPQNLENSPARFLRCCRLRHHQEKYEVELRGRGGLPRAWYPVDSLNPCDRLWWQLWPLHEVFLQLADEKRTSLRSAVNAIKGILGDIDEVQPPNDAASPSPEVTPKKNRRRWHGKRRRTPTTSKAKGRKS